MAPLPPVHPRPGERSRSAPRLRALRPVVVGACIIALVGAAGASAATPTTRRSSKRTTRTTRSARATAPVRPLAPIAVATTAPAAAGPTTATGGTTTTPVGSTTTVVAGAPAGPVSTLAWTPCPGSTRDCATLAVPLDYAAPDGPTIDIALERLRATNPAQRLGSVLINPGGPGGSGIGLLRGKGTTILNAAARARFDIVGFDPRGLGQSTKLRCASDQLRSARRAKEIGRTMAEACQFRQPELLAQITSEATARDMDRIRIALGEEKLNFLGISYGTVLGQWYLQLFPDRSRAIILDSALDFDRWGNEYWVDRLRTYDSLLTRFLTACQQSRTCAFNDGTDVGQRYDALLASLDASPVIADVNVGQTLTVDRTQVESLSIALIPRTGGAARFATLLAELARRDGSNARSVVAFLDSRIPSPGDVQINDEDDLAVNLAITCREGLHPSALADLSTFVARASAATPRYARYAERFARNELCAEWPFKADASKLPRPSGSPAALVFGSRDDPTTPFVWSEAVGRRLGVFVAVNGAEHGVVPDIACARDIASKFFLTTELPAPGTRC